MKWWMWLLAIPVCACGLLACAWAFSPVADDVLPSAANTAAGGLADLLRFVGCGLAVSVLTLSVTGACWLMSRASQPVLPPPTNYATWHSPEIAPTRAIETTYREVYEHAETGFRAD